MMIKTNTLDLFKMKSLLADLKHKQRIFAEDGNNSSFLKVCLSDGTSANVLYRMMRFFAKYKAGFLVAKLIQHLNKLLNQCIIGVNADFREGFVLMHPTGVIINSKVSGGKNIVIESGVVIGDEKGKSPKLENNIFIGSGAKIFGEITIGANSKIGANAVVVKDVISGNSVGGIPAKKLTQRQSFK